MGADVDLESSNGYVLRMGCMKKKGNIYEVRIRGACARVRYRIGINYQVLVAGTGWV